MSNLKVKIITGFRQEQHYSIDADEAHKAYYLFLNPDKRGIFNNGVAILGQDIRSIEPDYHSCMNWNSTHTLVDDDWNEIKKLGLDRQMRNIMILAREMAQLDKINQPLSGLAIERPQRNPEITDVSN